MPSLAEIRLRACKLWPYGSHAILSLVPVERPGLGTMAVDQHWRLYYDPQEIARQPLDESAGVVLHEISHLLLKHHRRAARVVPPDAPGASWQTWNVAADYAINSLLRDQGIPLWKDGVFPEQANFPPLLSAEDYFRRLTEQREQEEQAAQSQHQSDSDDESSDEPQSSDTNSENQAENSNCVSVNGVDTADDSGSQDDHPPNPDDSGSDGCPALGDAGCCDTNGEIQADNGSCVSVNGVEGRQDTSSASTGEDGDGRDPAETGAGEAVGPTSRPGAGDGGSCADGRQRPWELPAPPDCDTPGMAPHEADIMAAETAKRILEKGCGKGGGAWKRWAENILTPRVDPRQALLRHVRAAVEQSSGFGDYSYRRPNRRNPSPDMLRASPVQPVPRITVVVDTSGSMDQRDLGLCLGLIGKVLNGFRIRDGIQVMTGDVQAVTAARVFDPRQVQLGGGGGTDMGALIQEAAKSKPSPQLIVVATDGMTPWCERVTIPVVACLTSDSCRSDVPSWIKTLVLDERAGN